MQIALSAAIIEAMPIVPDRSGPRASGTRRRATIEKLGRAFAPLVAVNSSIWWFERALARAKKLGPLTDTPL